MGTLFVRLFRPLRLGPVATRGRLVALVALGLVVSTWAVPAKAVAEEDLLEPQIDVILPATAPEYGTPWTIDVEVGADGVVPTGTVEIVEPETTWPEVALVEGRATIEVGPRQFAAGYWHHFQVAYNGDDAVAAGTSDDVAVLVDRARPGFAMTMLRKPTHRRRGLFEVRAWSRSEALEEAPSGEAMVVISGHHRNWRTSCALDDDPIGDDDDQVRLQARQQVGPALTGVRCRQVAGVVDSTVRIRTLRLPRGTYRLRARFHGDGSYGSRLSRVRHFEVR